MTEFILIGAALLVWYLCVGFLLLSSHREEKRQEARGKDWR